MASAPLLEDGLFDDELFKDDPAALAEIWIADGKNAALLFTAAPKMYFALQAVLPWLARIEALSTIPELAKITADIRSAIQMTGQEPVA
jgi:hypothetical protein